MALGTCICNGCGLCDRHCPNSEKCMELLEGTPMFTWYNCRKDAEYDLGIWCRDCGKWMDEPNATGVKR